MVLNVLVSKETGQHHIQKMLEDFNHYLLGAPHILEYL